MATGGAAAYGQQPAGGGSPLLRQLAGSPVARAAVVAVLLAGLLQGVHLIGGGGGETREVRMCC